MPDQHGPAAMVLWVLLALGCALERPEDAAERAYMEYRGAILALDLEGVRSRVTGAHGREFDKPGASMALEIVRAMVPQELRIEQRTLADGKVTLHLTGLSIVDGDEPKTATPGEGTVEMLEEEGRWKVSKEAWSFDLSLAYPIFEPQPFLQDYQRAVARKILEGHQDGITQLGHTRSWRYLITASYGDYSLRVWDYETGQPVAMRTLSSRPTSLAVSPDGRTLYTATVHDTVLGWSLDDDGVLGGPAVLLPNAGRHVAASPDGKWLAVTSPGAPVVVHDGTDLLPVKTLRGSEPLRSVTFSPSGNRLAGSEGNQILVWETETWSPHAYRLPEVDPRASHSPVAWSPDGRHLGLASGDGSIAVLDVEEGRILHDFFVADAAALAIQFSRDGRQFVTSQSNAMINVWRLSDRQRVGFVQSRLGNAHALLFSGDGSQLIAGYERRRLVFWGARRPGEERAASAEDPRPISDLARPSPSPTPDRTTVFDRTNYLHNPDATQHEQFWRTSGDVSIGACGRGNPCFVTRYDGMFVGTAELPAGSAGKSMLLIGRAASERLRTDADDQTGESYIHGYGEPLDSADGLGEHYSADTLVTRTSEPDTWSVIWGVFPVGEQIRRIQLELRQADGRSSKTGSASYFDNLGVFLFDTPTEAERFVARYAQAARRTALVPDTTP